MQQNSINENNDPGSNQSIWEEIIDAVKGTEADYTKIDLKKAILLLSIPMILELMMESAFAVFDIFFVGKLGASAVATVGLTETYIFLLFSIAIGMSVAVTATVARRIGEHNKEEAAKTAVQSIIIGLLAAIPFSFAGIFYAQDLLIIMGADEWTINEGYRYAQWLLGGNVVIILLFVINAIFRGAGDAAIAMRVLFIANVINIIMDPILIFGLGPIPAFGIEGAAMASTFGRGIGVLVQLYALFKGGKHIKVTMDQLYLDAKVMLNIIKTSLGGIGQMIVAMTSWIFLMRILADVGSEAVAGATITIRIIMFTLMPAWGLSNAAATLVGQNLGAGYPDRAESSVWKIGAYNMYFLILVSFIYFFLSRSLVNIFTDDQRVIEIGAEWMRILSYSYFVYGWWMVAVQAFNGAGDTKTPTYINIVFFWLLQIPLSYYLAVTLNWEQSGVFWSVFITETSVGLFTLWLFKRGRWKKATV